MEKKSISGFWYREQPISALCKCVIILSLSIGAAKSGRNLHKSETSRRHRQCLRGCREGDIGSEFRATRAGASPRVSFVAPIFRVYNRGPLSRIVIVLGLV